VTFSSSLRRSRRCLPAPPALGRFMT
jgi:hypothetical protein